MSRAILVVDLQNDFMEGGVLAAKDTQSLIEPINAFVAASGLQGDICIFTRDWHPHNHSSFTLAGGPWPVHCVQNTFGASISSCVVVPDSAWIVDKGTAAESIGYSDFELPGLEQQLRAAGVLDIGVCGIATEYCVKANVLDAVARGFAVSVITDLIRPIEAMPGDAKRALAEMRNAGALMTTSEVWLKSAK